MSDDSWFNEDIRECPNCSCNRYWDPDEKLWICPKCNGTSEDDD